jgi:hypothetical protein
MKKSRIFMYFGALVLAITAVFATKANKKSFLPDIYYYNSATFEIIPLVNCSNNINFTALFTTTYTGVQALFSGYGLYCGPSYVFLWMKE